MRETLFNTILELIGTCVKLQGEDGTKKVYDYPITAPPGYPYAVISSDTMQSNVLDNQRDTRRYVFKIQVVGEKYGEQGAMSQADALKAMRATEDAVMAILDANYFLGRQDIVIRTMPLNATYGVNTDNGSRVVLSIELSVDTIVTIISSN